MIRQQGGGPETPGPRTGSSTGDDDWPGPREIVERLAKLETWFSVYRWALGITGTVVLGTLALFIRDALM